jgi:predicted DNA-binding transcriptional regulator AlpA
VSHKFADGRRFIRPKTLWQMLGISPATGWRKVKTDPRFPGP